MSFRRRRYMMIGIFSTILVVIIAGSMLVIHTVVLTYGSSNTESSSATAPASTLASVKQVAGHKVPVATASQVPVLVYHEMDNDCAASAPICQSHDYESVSTSQFTAEMAWMYDQGYHTVTMSQYLAWLANKQYKLPTKPFFITVDNGIGDFLEGAQPILYHYRFTAVAFLVTGFADGANGKCGPKISGVNVQPECPKGDIGWDLTWPQLKALSPSVYSFSIEAGQDGHYQQDYDKNCFAFNACKLPGESDAAYTIRVKSEMSDGIAELTSELGSRFNGDAWVVPYSDLGYTCPKTCTAYESYDGPSGWLVSYAATTFHAAFVQDPTRNGIRNERFRYEIHALDTLSDFKSAINGYLLSQSWAWR
jgi:hypothetical protein